MSVPQKAINLILKFEGFDEPSRWPGADSGITIGYGYDLGYEEHFRQDWGAILPAQQLDALSAALGKTGKAAAMLADRFKDINIPELPARAVFMEKSLPHYEAETLAAFPGLERLPEIVQGALVSLVYNRGTSMTGPRRAEMRAIRDAVKAGDLHEIAKQLRTMKRLWAGQGLGGLLARREAEAELVEEATSQ